MRARAAGKCWAPLGKGLLPDSCCSDLGQLSRRLEAESRVGWGSEMKNRKSKGMVITDGKWEEKRRGD